MKSKIFIWAMITWLAAGTVSAQSPKSQQDGRVRIAQQIQYYTALFALNESEAQQFDELYKAYTKQMRAIRNQYRKERIATDTTLTDEIVEKKILNNFAQSRAILNTREQYYKEFRKILTPSQINQIFEDEKERRAKVRH